jgi:hypothetical protein
MDRQRPVAVGAIDARAALGVAMDHVVVGMPETIAVAHREYHDARADGIQEPRSR